MNFFNVQNVDKNQNRLLQKLVTADFFIDAISIDLIHRRSHLFSKLVLEFLSKITSFYRVNLEKIVAPKKYSTNNLTVLHKIIAIIVFCQ